MQTRRWNKKQIGLFASLILIFLVFLRARSFEFEIQNTIRNVQPLIVWEYMSDFSKMRLFDPTIQSFQVLSDHGNANNWYYSVRYTQKRSQFPYISYMTNADYVVTKLMDHKHSSPPIFQVNSVHTTCYFGSFYCLRLESYIEITASGSNTQCVDKIIYQCPLFLSGMCLKEHQYQKQVAIKSVISILEK